MCRSGFWYAFILLRAALVDVSSSLHYKYLNTESQPKKEPSAVAVTLKNLQTKLCP
jgi:hypothetical protein